MRLRNKNFRIEVLDRTELATRQGGHRDPLGVTTTTRFMRTKNVVDYMKIDGVAILKGLPVALFEGVCTHELGHIWLAQHSVVNLPLVDEEGFCELLAHSRYSAIGSKTDLFYARRIAENQSPVYGAGFRKLKKLEARIGFEAILKALQRKKKLPL